MYPARLHRRNALFQQWQALLTNRTKRTQSGQLLVQGVRPVSLAVQHGHDVHALLVDDRASLSTWARETIASTGAPVTRVASELMAELGERTDGPPELLAVVAQPADDLDRLSSDGLIVVFDRPGSPGNIGSLARSVDALGGSGLVTTGHSADAWDPASVPASTGSIFAVPVVRAPGHAAVLDWARNRPTPLPVIGTDEGGTVELMDAPLAGPALVVIGSETSGMSHGWKAACDLVTSIPMTGAASSLNAASAGSIVLYEGLRQRRSG